MMESAGRKQFALWPGEPTGYKLYWKWGLGETGRTVVNICLDRAKAVLWGGGGVGPLVHWVGTELDRSRSHRGQQNGQGKGRLGQLYHEIDAEGIEGERPLRIF